MLVVCNSYSATCNRINMPKEISPFMFTGFEIDYDAETSAFTTECREFMNKFVSKIFSGR